MPLVLWRHLEWTVLFVAPLITMLLAGIDNIGIFIENPFSILPMATYCTAIHENVILAGADWASGNDQVRHAAFAPQDDGDSWVHHLLTRSGIWQLSQRLAPSELQDAGALVDLMLSSRPPAWQQVRIEEGPPCVGSDDGLDSNSLTPAVYRIGRSSSIRGELRPSKQC
jgi:hypothetical protein